MGIQHDSTINDGKIYAIYSDIMGYKDTVDGCEILHHQFGMVETQTK
jgi:hypothetical protein